MRNHGVVTDASGLVPFGHLGWAYRDRAEFAARAAEYILDGRAHDQWVEFVGHGTRASLRDELAAVLGPDYDPRDTGITVTPLEDFYDCPRGTDVVDPERAVAARIAGTQQALAAGYAGFRAVVDVTAVARTPEQRAAFSRFELLIDEQMALHPVSALCAVDAAALGDSADELACLHPYTGPGLPFRLFADPPTGYVLAGRIDRSAEDLLALVLQRVGPLLDGREIALDAQGLRTRELSSLVGAEPVDRLVRDLHDHEQKLRNLPVIEQAKGMLMQNLDLGPDQAFDRLRQISQITNVKLREVAAHVVEELTGIASTHTCVMTGRTLQRLTERLRGKRQAGGRRPVPASRVPRPRPDGRATPPRA